MVSLLANLELTKPNTCFCRFSSKVLPASSLLICHPNYSHRCFSIKSLPNLWCTFPIRKYLEYLRDHAEAHCVRKLYFSIAFICSKSRNRREQIHPAFGACGEGWGRKRPRSLDQKSSTMSMCTHLTRFSRMWENTGRRRCR